MQPSCLTVLTFPDWGLNLDRIRNIFDKNAQKLDFRPIGNVETQEHVLAWVACSFLAYSDIPHTLGIVLVEKTYTLALLCGLQYFFFSSSIHPSGVNSNMEFPSQKGGGTPLQCSWCGGWDALREMFMLILFPTNAAAMFQIYYGNGYTRRSYLIDIDWHLEILYNIYEVHKKLSTE